MISHPDSKQLLLADICRVGSTTWTAGAASGSPQASVWWNVGTGWSIAPFHALKGGPVTGFVRFSAITGFSDNRVFMAGAKMFDDLASSNPRDSAFVLEFRHGLWVQHLLPGHELYCIGGTSGDNLWAGGRHGTLLHFDGVQWKPESTGILARAGSAYEVFFESIASDGGEGAFLIARLTPGYVEGQTYYLLRRINKAWSVIDSSREGAPKPVGWGTARLFRLSSGELYSSGDGVYHWNGNGWASLFSYSSGTGIMFGSSPSNLFVLAGGPKVFHYDGSNWAELGQLSKFPEPFVGGAATSQEAFVIRIVFEPSQTISEIITGR